MSDTTAVFYQIFTIKITLTFELFSFYYYQQPNSLLRSHVTSGAVDLAKGSLTFDILYAVRAVESVTSGVVNMQNRALRLCLCGNGWVLRKGAKVRIGWSEK